MLPIRRWIENRLPVFVHRHTAGGRKRKVVVIGPDGVKNGGQVPGWPIVRHGHVAAVGLSHRVIGDPGEIPFDAGRREQQRLADFEAAEHNRRRPFLKDLPRRRNIGLHVVFGLPPREMARHGAEEANLLRDQPGAWQRAGFVRAGSQQPGEVGTEADHHDHHAAVRRLREHAAQYRHGVRGIPAVRQTMWVDIRPSRIPALGRHANHGTVAGCFPVLHHADGDVLSAVKRVDEIDKGRREAVVLADRDSQ